MTQFSIEQLKDNVLADSANTLANIASGARNAVCGVYRASPGFMLPSDGTALPPLEPLADAYRAMFDNLCGDQPLPQLPPRLTGGKCAVNYIVSYQTQTPAAGGGVTTNPGTALLLGPIGGVQLRDVAGSPGQTEFGIVHRGGAGFFGVLAFTKAQPRASEFSAQIQAITPQVPGSDNCGDVPTTYPPRVTPPGTYSPPVTYRDRGVSINLPGLIPPIIIPPGAVQITPEINIKVGPNNVKFDFSGATVKLEVNPTVNVTIGGGNGVANPNPPTNITPDDSLDEIADRLDRLEDLIEDVKKCACDDGYSGSLVTTIGNPANSQCVSVSTTRNRFCAIALGQQPIKTKIQSGGAAPDVLYAGWAWFKAGDYLFERQPIDGSGKIFRNPGGAESFCYTLYSGFTGTPIILDEPTPPA